MRQGAKSMAEQQPVSVATLKATSGPWIFGGKLPTCLDLRMVPASLLFTPSNREPS